MELQETWNSQNNPDKERNKKTHIFLFQNLLQRSINQDSDACQCGTGMKIDLKIN